MIPSRWISQCTGFFFIRHYITALSWMQSEGKGNGQKEKYAQMPEQVKLMLLVSEVDDVTGYTKSVRHAAISII